MGGGAAGLAKPATVGAVRPTAVRTGVNADSGHLRRGGKRFAGEPDPGNTRAPSQRTREGQQRSNPTDEPGIYLIPAATQSGRATVVRAPSLITINFAG